MLCMVPSEAIKTFISYAHKDGSDLARRLHDDLKAEDQVSLSCLAETGHFQLVTTWAIPPIMPSGANQLPAKRKNS